MKQLLVMLLSIATLHVTAQNTSIRSAFRNGYMREGLNFLGNKLDNNLSLKDNVFNGNFGAATGYCFESGRNFYFNKNSLSPIRYGLDWTCISSTFNKMNWKNYSNTSSGTDTYIDGNSIAASVSSRIGPAISFNPIEKLVIDARFK